MKKILIAMTLVLALAVGAVLVVPSFIDWSSYRAEIAKEVEKATGRDLIIGGDIVFSVLPAPVLKVGDIKLSNRAGSDVSDMVSMRQLDVRISLLPLLTGNVHVQSIRLIEPVVYLEVSKDGSPNWAFTPKGAAKEPENLEMARRADAPSFEVDTGASNEELPIQIDDFFIENAEVVFVDHQSGFSERLSEVNTRFAIAGLSGPFEAAGTMKARGLSVGFAGTLGKILHGRTATFGAELKLAHGDTTARVNGTFVQLAQGPKVQGKLAVNGKSLAGLISAFSGEGDLPGGLDRTFSLEGEPLFTGGKLSFGEAGLALKVGDDHGKLNLDFANEEIKKAKAGLQFTKIDLDKWIEAKPYKPATPADLPMVFEPVGAQLKKGGQQVSVALSAPVKKAAEQAAMQQTKENAGFKLPKDIEAEVTLSVDAMMLKGEPIRQFYMGGSLEDGEIALERLSAILPGAGEVSVVGVAGERDGVLQFDGSLDLNVAHLRGALDWFGVDVDHVPTERLQQVDAKMQILANEKEVSFSDVVVRMDGSTLNGAAAIALRKRPSFGLSLKLDRILADAYIKKASQTAAQGANSEGQTAKTGNGDVTATSKNEASILAPALEAFAKLNSFDANLNLALGQLNYQGQEVRNLYLDALIYNGALSIRKASVGSFAGVAADLKGSLSAQNGLLQANDLSLNVAGKTLAGAAKLAGVETMMDWAALGPVALSASVNGNVLAPEVNLTLDALGGNVIIAGAGEVLPKPKADASVSLQFDNIEQVTRGLGLSYQPSGNPGRVSLKSDVVFDLAQIDVKNLTGQIGKGEFSGKINVKQGKRPFIDALLKTTELDVTPFIPKEAQSQNAVNDNRQVQGATGSSSQAVGSRASKWSDVPIKIEGLDGFDANFKLRSDAIKKDKLVLKDVVLNADLRNGVLVIDKSTASLFGGEVVLNSKIKTGDQVALDLNVKASQLQLAQALVQTGNSAAAKGLVDFKADVKASGQSERQLVSSLTGTVESNLSKVSMASQKSGGSVLEILNLLALLSGSDPAKGLADVKIVSPIANGVATLQTASLNSTIANGNATGNVDLPNWAVDVNGNLQVQQNALIGLLAQKTKMKSSYPFSIKGALDQPNVKLDTGGLSSGGGLVIPLPDKLEKNGVGGLIRGLMGVQGGQIESKPQSPSSEPAPAADGTIAPPPPPSGTSGSTTQQKAPSVEQQLLQGLGTILRNR